MLLPVFCAVVESLLIDVLSECLLTLRRGKQRSFLTGDTMPNNTRSRRELFKKAKAQFATALSRAYEATKETARKVWNAVFDTVAWIISKLKSAFAWLWENPRWIWAGILIVAGIFFSSWLEEHYKLLDMRYRSFAFTQRLNAYWHGELYDESTIVVLIGDEEFWKGSYEGRLPLNKQSLSELVTALDKYQPKVIALDFDFSSPMPDGSIVEFKRYECETKTFAATIKEVSKHRSVILARTVGSNGGTASDVYDNLDLGNADFGFIALSRDYRTIPLSMLVAYDEPRLDSFSEAIVRSFDLTGKSLRSDKQDDSIVYTAGYLYEQDFKRFFANQVLHPDSATEKELAEKIPGKIVIVGGAWSRQAYGRGERTDTRDTPVGAMPAVFLHANWVESLLHSRTARPLGEIPRWILELLLGFAGYYVLTSKMWWLFKGLYLLAVPLAWFLIAYLSLHNLGLFFDPFTVTLIGLAKAGGEQVNEWRKDSKKLRSQEPPQAAATTQTSLGAPS